MKDVRSVRIIRIKASFYSTRITISRPDKILNLHVLFPADGIVTREIMVVVSNK